MILGGAWGLSAVRTRVNSSFNCCSVRSNWLGGGTRSLGPDQSPSPSPSSISLNPSSSWDKYGWHKAVRRSFVVVVVGEGGAPPQYCKMIIFSLMSQKGAPLLWQTLLRGYVALVMLCVSYLPPRSPRTRMESCFRFHNTSASHQHALFLQARVSQLNIIKITNS